MKKKKDSNLWASCNGSVCGLTLQLLFSCWIMLLCRWYFRVRHHIILEDVLLSWKQSAHYLNSVIFYKNIITLNILRCPYLIDLVCLGEADHFCVFSCAVCCVWEREVGGRGPDWLWRMSPWKAVWNAALCGPPNPPSRQIMSGLREEKSTVKI